MYIRRTKTKSLSDGSAYYTYRIVESVRIGTQVKQRTLLNLGKDFTIEQTQWHLLIARIEQLQQGDLSQSSLFATDELVDPVLETAAQHYSALIIERLSQPIEETKPASSYHLIDLNQVNPIRSRSIGTETLALHALQQLQLDQKLEALGFNKRDSAAAIGSIIGRMVSPGSELSTLDWLQTRSGLGELLGHDYEKTRLTRLYQVSDKLLDNQAALDTFLARQEQSLFNLDRSIVLYDLTNTYFEGQCALNEKARHGRSKEKRSDCPLVTLGLVLDGEGFPLSSQVFPGNASEPATLAQMIEKLKDKDPINRVNPVIIMDAGIATQDNLDWLVERQYDYLVVSREQIKEKQHPNEHEDTISIRDQGNSQVKAYKVTDPETQETRLYCYSTQKAKKEQSIRTLFHERLETALTQLNAGLSKKGTVKNYAKILEGIGRLREKHSKVAQDYHIDVIADETKSKAINIKWHRDEKSEQKDQQCGMYCLRTTIQDWSEERLWHTYTVLTEIEATFKSLKSELGMRPIYHQKEERITGHLFITLLAYHLVHTLRFQLKQQGINMSWTSLRNIMSTQQRLTITLPTDDQKIIHLRTTTKAEYRQTEIYNALGIKSDVLGKQKTEVKKICSAN